MHKSFWLVVRVMSHGTECVTNCIVEGVTKRDALRKARQRYGNVALRLVRL